MATSQLWVTKPNTIVSADIAANDADAVVLVPVPVAVSSMSVVASCPLISEMENVMTVPAQLSIPATETVTVNVPEEVVIGAV